MDRREFLKILGVTSLCSVVPYITYQKLLKYHFDTNILYPGMRIGHQFRDQINNNLTFINKESDVTIIGSGISALTAAYKLIKENYSGKIILIIGPEKFGNSSNIKIDNEEYPTGAHYLPLQTIESKYVREILFDFNIITEDPYSEYPTYNEKDLVQSPMERFLDKDEWIEGNHQHNEEFEKFTKIIDQFKNKTDSNNQPLFTFPIAYCSNEMKYLENISFSSWLIENNITYKELIHYLNYCVRDDYGVNIDQCSAFAGILYFAGRNGKAKNINSDTVMTWQNGNSHIAKLLFNFIKDKVEILEATANKVEKNSVQAFNDKNNYSIKSDNIVIATPLFVTNRLLTKGTFDKKLIPNYSTWLISNFLFEELPREIFKGCGLAYDNVLNNSENLGYIYSSNQSLNISRENRVLTTYTNIPTTNFSDTRKLISELTKEDLLDIGLKDIVDSFGAGCLSKIKSAHITVRGHAMSFPDVGFLSKNKEISTFQDKLAMDSIYLAHSDLSRISTFEEATYHGFTAAQQIIKQNS